jgi:hypothetical protein
MYYLKVIWKHVLRDEPVVIYMELNNNRYEVRKIEVYRDGKVGYAYEHTEIGESALSEKPIPSIKQIAKDKQFAPNRISKNEFESMWQKYVLKHK